jgi:cell wall-associated NlpC family hydrolase
MPTKTKWYTPKQVAKIVAVAVKFVEASIAGKCIVTIGQVTHRPLTGGMCSRFVRQSVEAGLGKAEHALDNLFGATANETARKLREVGYSIGDTSDLRPGDIVYRSGGPGHVAMYLGTQVPGHEGVELFAENTSVATRGFPARAGTKYTWRGTGALDFGCWQKVFRLTRPEE